ncbi:glutathione-regulated potassium-efflux system ancillary protein KefG [Edwardsiella piscicida]|nr:glutathione-regulated potassium-efflux system ancillary protein KefG [Edwardsiella piscicida]
MAHSPKVLLIYAHPESPSSVANQLLLQAAQRLSNVTVHDLYAHYPDFFIDIHHEQHLLRNHQVIVFQHPLYNYSCPALLKEWLDRVLARGFASGVGGYALRDKYWRSVVTTGEPEGAYQLAGYNHYTMGEVLRPFELTALRCHMRWLPPLTIYWARRQRLEMLHAQAHDYAEWLAAPLPAGGDDER